MVLVVSLKQKESGGPDKLYDYFAYADHVWSVSVALMCFHSGALAYFGMRH